MSQVERLKTFKEAQSITFIQLGERLGINERTLRRWFKGRKASRLGLMMVKIYLDESDDENLPNGDENGQNL